ncbi:GrpB family protein [Mesorhizobium sp.]|uniref:GrpB family protein n=1 Tax=Mesorhizobium sp. TaxID=1871066 RepID=UPI001204FB0B|nr:GrpB family protein [Mesorhizobium sp.]TIN10611.1 MAG: GrpB family protein [Mesorhizobium sp.]
MALTSQISAYDAKWPDMFLSEKCRIEEAFGSELVQIHHVGSTAVPGLAAKPEIDLLVEVREHRDETRVANFMKSIGYVRGKDLSPDHHFYRRDVNGVRTHKVHVCPSGHWQISRMRRFRDLLRADANLRKRYEDLKLQLEAENEHGIKEYLALKAPFIDAVVGPEPKDKQ